MGFNNQDSLYSPCMGCDRRKVSAEYNCHNDCKDYIDFKDEVQKRKNFLIEQNKKNPLIKEFHFLGNKGNLTLHLGKGARKKFDKKTYR